jgi:hypothetical protein
MTSVGIIANSNKETILQAIELLKQLPGFKIIFIRQSEEKLYIVNDKTFSIVGGVNHEQQQ